MSLDVCISAGLAVLTILMAYLGIRVTLHPVDSPRAIRWYKVGFSICAVAAVLLVVFQGIRNAKSQFVLQNQIGDLKQILNEQQHTHIHISVSNSIAVNPGERTDKPILPFRPELKTRFNVVYRNAGITVAGHTRVAGTIHLVTSINKSDLDAMFLDLRNAFNRTGRGDDLSPQGQAFFTVESRIVSRKDVQDIVTGKVRVFIVALAKFSDRTGDYEQEMCYWLQPPGDAPIWHGCGTHDQEIRIAS